ncbi:hypothetical protein FYJ26_04545 [Anaerococcus sp. WCA-380-WT-2B]|uniref:Polysaccharide pyruvyl transferase domain-containing protein n=1 Tax=Anaerococcus porci TaxID=2652269 RepID=A0A6N7VUE1_9FIRM|nr:polysaccharide pyruvyl transferase family protein [Anaerococcus porci]MSS77683.1 hypothetical protein [Anaerococcus porci]
MKKILIASHYNRNNGDRAVLESTVRILKEIDNNIEITVSTTDPSDLIDKRFKVVDWPVKNKKIYKLIFRAIASLGRVSLLKKYYKLFVDKEYLNAIKESDIVLVTGGHHLTDILGVKNFYNLAINYLVPIFEDKKIYLMPQSIGPVDENNMRNVSKYILEKVNNIAYRDKSSKIFLDELSIDTPYIYVPDIVFTLPRYNSKTQSKRIGIALYCSYVGDKKDKLLPFVKKNLIDLIYIYVKEGYKFSIISMDPNDLEVSNDILREVNTQFDSSVVNIEKPETNSILDTVKLFSSKELILAYKTHSVVFSLINYVPVVAIAYHPKSIEFMEKINLMEYSIKDEFASTENLQELVNRALSNKCEIIDLEKKGIEKNKKLIMNYLNSILYSK